jgi:GntR family transcriptional regulator/MocR family aminotransferase
LAADQLNKSAAHPPAAWLILDRDAGDLAGQVYRAIRDRILGGQLQPGQKLPATRALSAAVSVARATIVEAYERLRAEGYLEATAGTASRVASFAGPLLAGQAPRQLEPVAPPATPPPTLAMTPGVPDLARFPHATWGRILGARARSLRLHDLGYGEPAGIAALRESILAHVALTRGVVASAEQVVILPSTKAAIRLLADLLLAGPQAQETVWIEDPGYPTAQHLFAKTGAALVPVPVDAAGIDIARAPAGRPRLIYVTPSHQYPTGVTMTLARRLSLLDFARASGAVILEDDYDSEFQFDTQPIASLQGIDRHGVVAYLGTLSKVLAPGLRVAYAILPLRLMTEAAKAVALQGVSVPVHIQAALADFLREGHLRAHIRRMTPIYAARMAEVAAALRYHCGDRLALGPGTGGLQLAARFCEPAIDDQAIARQLVGRGFGPQALSSMYLSDARAGLLLGIARLMPGEADAAAQVINGALTGARRDRHLEAVQAVAPDGQLRGDVR